MPLRVWTHLGSLRNHITSGPRPPWKAAVGHTLPVVNICNIIHKWVAAMWPLAISLMQQLVNANAILSLYIVIISRLTHSIDAVWGCPSRAQYTVTNFRTDVG